MFGLRKQIEPLVAEAQETMTVARAQLGAVVLLTAAALVVSLLTLLVVSRRD